MLLNNIKKNENTIFIYGINKISILLANYLLNNQIKVIFGYSYEDSVEEFEDQLPQSNPLFTVVDIDKFDFNLADYVILSDDILLNSEELKSFLTRLDNIKNKVFVDIEFMYMLFPENKYIGIIGSNYSYTTSIMLNKILNNNDLKYLDFSTNNTNCKDFTNGCICFCAIQDYKIKYLKQISFNILAILDIDLNLGKNTDFINYIRNDVLSNQNSNSLVICNIDNDYLKDVYENINDDEKSNYNIIPISVNKMLYDGMSYINGTVYNYFDNKNESYDVTTDDYILSNISKMALLCTMTISICNNFHIDDVIESIKNFKGLENCLEKIDQIENTSFISNVFANTPMLLNTPFKIYEDIYVIFCVNDKHLDLSLVNKYFNNLKSIVFVDVCGLLKTDKIKNNNIVKYSNLKEAFDYVINKMETEEKETNTTVLLSSIVNDEMNSIYYKDYAVEFKKLIKDIK